MKVGKQLPEFPRGQDWSIDDIKRMLVWQQQFLTEIRRHFNSGDIGFGDGSAADNIYGVWVTYTSNAVANTEDTVAHNLGVIPVGYIVMSLDKAAVIYKGATAWTSTNIYLKSNTATTVALLFIVGPSNKGY